MKSSYLDNPEVSVLVPCRNEREHIQESLRSILNQDEPEGGFEVIVADGLSDDGTREILSRLAEENPRLRVTDNPGQIVSTGLNAAIRVARGQIIIRMDAHTQYSPDYVRQCVAVLQESGADNVGGPWLAKGAGIISRAIAAAFQSFFAVGGARSHATNYEGEVDSVYLGCWRRQAFERFGFFDEELIRNQDDELNLRITRGGGQVWQSPRIRSWYRPRGSLVALFQQYAQYGYWKVRVIRKHRLPASPRHLVPGSFILFLSLLSLLSGFCVLFSRVLPGAAGLLRDTLLLLAGVLGFYGLCVSAASLHTAAKSEWKLLPILPLVFCCYHFGYGWGFLRGSLDFLMRGRGSSGAFAELTRKAEA